MTRERADHALIYQLEVELGIVEQPRTREACVERLREIEDEHQGQQLPETARAEWKALAARLHHLQDEVMRARAAQATLDALRWAPTQPRVRRGAPGGAGGPP